LSNLKEGNHSFTVGLPGNKIPESKFTVVITHKDRGFLLKSLDNKLSLFDLQSLELINPTIVPSGGNSQQTITRTDAFTKLLAQVTDDPSLLNAVVMPPPQKEEKRDLAKSTADKPDRGKRETKPEEKPEPPGNSTTILANKDTQQEQKKLPDPIADNSQKAIDSFTTKAEEKITAEVKKPEIIQQPAEDKANGEISRVAEPYVKSVITKHAESSTTEGFGLVYLDNQYGKIDTIRLLIPNQKRNFKETVEEKKEEKTTTVKVPKIHPEQSVLKSKENTDSSSKKDKSITKKTLQKNTCKGFAGERDFMRLRKNMASKTSDEAMIDEAKKYFRQSCFSTTQIKNLSVLFLTSSGKYQFFDAAYRHISDLDQFSTLQSEIKDEYYLKRFKALIGE
ncbi:MAG: DUF4476 domain-containing protein, partial [Chitinophagaceae bacterium]